MDFQKAVYARDKRNQTSRTVQRGWLESLAIRFALMMRRRMYGTFTAAGAPALESSTLEVDATSDRCDASSNFRETSHSRKHRITEAATDAPYFLADRSPGPRYVRVNDTSLPFTGGELDLVYANAEVEHVGSRAEQTDLVAVLRLGDLIPLLRVQVISGIAARLMHLLRLAFSLGLFPNKAPVGVKCSR